MSKFGTLEITTFTTTPAMILTTPTTQVPRFLEWNAFKSKCEAAGPLYCSKLWDTSLSDALDGNKGMCPVFLPSPDSTRKCDAENVGDGTCNVECLSEACFFDGGDCAGKDLLPDPYGDGQTESAFSTSDAFLRVYNLTLHWIRHSG